MAIAPGEFDPDKVGIPDNEYGEGRGLISSGQGTGGGGAWGGVNTGWSGPSISGDSGGGWGSLPSGPALSWGGYTPSSSEGPPGGLANSGSLAGGIAGGIAGALSLLAGGGGSGSQGSNSSTTNITTSTPAPESGKGVEFGGGRSPAELEGTPGWRAVSQRKNRWTEGE